MLSFVNSEFTDIAPYDVGNDRRCTQYVAMSRWYKEFRNAAGLTAEAVAERLDMSTGQLSRLENGHSDATTKRLEQMAKIYGCESWQLIGPTGPNSPETATDGEPEIRFDNDLLAEVIEGLEESLQDWGVVLDPKSKAEAVTKIYTYYATSDQPIEEKSLAALLRMLPIKQRARS